MTENNPYQAPESSINEGRLANDTDVERIAKAQKLIIYAILVNIFSMFAVKYSPLFGAILSVVVLVMAIFGIIRLANGLGFSAAKQVLVIILMFVPLVNFINLLILNSRATAKLRESGYRVGLLGASKTQA